MKTPKGRSKVIPARRGARPETENSGSFSKAAESLAEIGRGFYARGWVLGTSGNFSVVISRKPLRLAITSTGLDKGALSAKQFLEIDETANVVRGEGRPSAEALLHLAIVRNVEGGAVLHTHSVWSTVLSGTHARHGGIALEGYEMLKGLAAVETHKHREWLPILENSRDVVELADRVTSTLRETPGIHGFLLQAHGLYTKLGRSQAPREDSGVSDGSSGAIRRRTECVRAGRHGQEQIAMALLRIPDEQRSLFEHDEVRDYLAGIGIEYERWETPANLPEDASAEQVLSTYAPQLEECKRRGGYVTADVIDVNRDTPGLDAMLAKFNIEHTHDEDEVRYIISGRGLFHIHPPQGPVVAIEVKAGDLIRVPRGTLHWFDLCGDRRIRAIRLFQDKSGWTPHYTGSGVDRSYKPVCWGPRYIPPQIPAK